MSDSLRAWLQIHFCVLLWGFTAILGKAITLPALPLVWWRMTLVAASLLIVPTFWRGIAKLSLRQMATFAGIGTVVAAHWLTFYGAIKLSNASVAATSMALSPVLIALVEPLIVGRRFDVRELFFGIAVIPGVALVVGGTPSYMRAGVAVGVLSAFFVAIFGSLNKRFIDHGDALSITGLEMGAGALVLALASPLFPKSEAAFVIPDRHDAILLFVLAMGCTLLPFALSLVALRHLTAFATGLAVNMEPVYAILLAIVIFGEQKELGAAFYAGVGIIFVVVFSHPFLARYSSASVTGEAPVRE
ncbi:MAG TPA: DMT family transporter [Terriglobia bacterium]|nr:DMT family transporter [Terriglobia bacterium]